MKKLYIKPEAWVVMVRTPKSLKYSQPFKTKVAALAAKKKLKSHVPKNAMVFLYPSMLPRNKK